ncbi:MAG TPA: neocarzinostatin apoprotein domain-containing protein [Acidimicrobiales bacterium]|nr:neocarzinostatin apoprotein domain-containing protein [Acidimicrobiales bacterium]
MNVQRSARFLAALGLGSVLLLGAPIAGAVKATPHLFVTPSGSVRNGETVKVRGVAFKPHDSIYLIECLAKASGQSGCDMNTLTPVSVNAKGAFGWTKFKIASGKIGSGTCGTKKTNLKACAISAGNASGGDSAVFRITFVMPPGKNKG